MTATEVRRRRFDASRDARLFVKLLTPDGVLVEAVAMRGFGRDGPQVGSLRLLPVGVPWCSEWHAAEHPSGVWHSVGSLSRMRVVEG